MASYKIISSPLATESYLQNIEYLKTEWTQKGVIHFIQKVSDVVDILKVNPQTFQKWQRNKSIHKVQLDSLKVNFNVSNFYIKIKGYVNDTCYINKNKLNGQIDTVIKGDWYYNTYHLKYEPNKAKKGELKIEYGLY